MSDTTSETGSADAPAEKRVRKPRVTKAAAPASAETSAPAQAGLPLANAPEAPRPAAPAAAAPSAPAAEAPAAHGGDGNEGRESGQGRPQQNNNNNQAVGQQNTAGGQNQGPYQGNQQNNGQGQGNRRDRFRNRRDRDRPARGGGRDDGLPQDNNEQQPFVRTQQANVPEGFPVYSLSDLKRMPAQKLLEIAEQLQISEGVALARKQEDRKSVV